VPLAPGARRSRAPSARRSTRPATQVVVYDPSKQARNLGPRGLAVLRGKLAGFVLVCYEPQTKRQEFSVVRACCVRGAPLHWEAAVRSHDCLTCVHARARSQPIDASLRLALPQPLYIGFFDAEVDSADAPLADRCDR
jgi:hypothetical protein